MRGEWNKIGSNINQIAKEVNMARTPRLGSFESEWHELTDRVERDFSEFRTLLMQALGEERGRKPTKE
jgi:Bacterial mobilisation protein (MobC)